MQNIKNFRPYDPPAHLREKYGDPKSGGPLFLCSENGLDWYESQELFSDDTIKIMYDGKGIIRGLIDKPIPQRGNILAVSMFFPDGMSVAELECAPDGCSNDGAWLYDGEEVTPVPVDYVGQAEREKTQRMAEASRVIVPLQDAVDLGMATKEEESQLDAWKKYRVELNRVNTSVAPDITWPEKPNVLS